MTKNLLNFFFCTTFTIFISSSCKIENVTQEKLGKNILNSLINNNLETALDMNLTKAELLDICEKSGEEFNLKVLEENGNYRTAKTKAEKEKAIQTRVKELQENITDCFKRCRNLACSKTNCRGEADGHWPLAKFISFETLPKENKEMEVSNIAVKFSYGDIKYKIIIEAVKTTNGWKIIDDFYLDNWSN
jgi:arsenate reductase-like glutaredoxin family protein